MMSKIDSARKGRLSVAENSVLKWILANGHKVLIWIQFFIAVVLWITADPSPGELMKTLQECLTAGN